MSRYSGSSSYGHKIRRECGTWIVSWTYDRYYSDCLGRFPQTRSCTTTDKGAIRFCKKWNVNIPEELK